MTNFHYHEDAEVYNNRSLTQLVWTIEASVGQLSLILAHCNYAHLREELVQRVKTLCSVNLRVIVLQETTKTLYTTLREELKEEQPQAVMVLGLESVQDIDQLLISTNHVREKFRKNFLFPLVLWVNDQVLEKLIRLAPDFENWTTTTEFVISTEMLLYELQQRVNDLFNKLLDLGTEQFLTSDPIFAPTYRLETLRAWQDLQCRGQVIEQELQAGVDLALGRDNYIRNNIEIAKEHYQKSLDFWQQTNQLERQGILQFHIGLCFYRLAEQDISQSYSYRTEAKNYFQKTIDSFEQGQRQDLVAKFINQLGEVLKYLKDWDDLQKLALRSLKLQEIYSNPIRLAQSYGFLAEAALGKSQSIEAQQYAQAALQEIAHVPFEQQQNQNLYLLLLAKAHQCLGQPSEAITNLKEAKKLNYQNNPQLYIDILDILRMLYLEQKDYLQAFQVKQEKRSVQQQYHFRAFVGAGRLKLAPQQLGLTQTERQKLVAQEIESFGRKKAIDDLVERIGTTQHKLTVVYGQSGVGKSSMLEAGLIPTLTSKTIGIRDVLPISIRFYKNWPSELSKELANTLNQVSINTSITSNNKSLEEILKQLQYNEQHNILTVLIFDQFEEFFLTCDRNERDRFFEFFRDCLNIPFVKIFLSLREDYLYFLVAGTRKTNLDIINNNILDKQILYYIGNFLPEEAKSIILSLSKRSQFNLETELIDQLVNDLASELGEVRPIELQIVGYQLQTENITTLVQYRERGPKEALVQRYLEDVVKDCGDENKQAAKLILYLLTGEKDTRPFKTRTELENSLRELATGLAQENSKLDLVLRIFVESGLVFLLRENPVDRYQLVHDYLVSFIRHQQEPQIKELKEKLEKEIDKRLRVEEELKTIEEQKQVIEKHKQQAQAELREIEEANVNLANKIKNQKQAVKRLQNINLLYHKRIITFFCICALVLIVLTIITQFQQKSLLKGYNIATSGLENLSDKPWANVLLGQIYRRVGDYENAQKKLDTVINNEMSMKPTSEEKIQAYFERSQIYNCTRRRTEALYDIDNAIKIIHQQKHVSRYQKIIDYKDKINDLNPLGLYCSDD